MDTAAAAATHKTQRSMRLATTQLYQLKQDVGGWRLAGTHTRAAQAHLPAAC